MEYEIKKFRYKFCINGDCYICKEPSSYLSPCNCNNLFLHKECFIKNLKINNNIESKTFCSICSCKLVTINYINNIPVNTEIINTDNISNNTSNINSLLSISFSILCIFIIMFTVSVFIIIYLIKLFIYFTSSDFDYNISKNDLFISIIINMILYFCLVTYLNRNKR